MVDVVLTWERFESIRKARERFRKTPCVYALIDQTGQILRIGGLLFVQRLG
jgi:hypothetical protein